MKQITLDDFLALESLYIGSCSLTHVSVGYHGWKSICKSLEKHQSSGAHKSSIARWASFNQSKDRGAVADMLVSQRRTIIQENRKYLQTAEDSPFVCSSGPGTKRS